MSSGRLKIIRSHEMDNYLQRKASDKKALPVEKEPIRISQTYGKGKEESLKSALEALEVEDEDLMSEDETPKAPPLLPKVSDWDEPDDTLDKSSINDLSKSQKSNFFQDITGSS